MSQVKDYYKILGISETADVEAIRQAFMTLAKQYPDGSNPVAKDLKEAFDVLANPQKRVQYDAYRAKKISTGQLEDALANGSKNGAQRQRWTYLTLGSSTNYGTTKYYINGEMQPDLKNGNFSEIINTLGSDGWEMVGMGTMGEEQVFIFKRPSDQAYVAPKKGPAA